jgi:cytochrome c peroxidase
MLKNIIKPGFIVMALAFFVALVINSCIKDDEEPTSETGPTPYEFPEMQNFPTNLNIPEDNPMTEEGVLLGRYLFYDGRLSGRTHPDSLMSCGTCHIQSKGFECGIDHPVFKGGKTFGLSGKETPHFMLPIVNMVFNHNGYLWNGLIHGSNTYLGSQSYGVPAEEQYHYKNIESLVWMGISAPHEMSGNIERTVHTIANISIYPPMFKKAFGTEEVTYDRIAKSIAQFIRTIVSYRSKFHKSWRGEAELTALEHHGFALFFSEDGDCFHCHGGSILMTTNEYYNNAKDSVFTDDRDRYSITGDVRDIGAYKAPSLINIELTAPYMHDGRFKTIDEVIDFYSDGLIATEYVHPLMETLPNGGARLSHEEKEALKAFLFSLTDHDLINDPQYSRPTDLVDGGH